MHSERAAYHSGSGIEASAGPGPGEGARHLQARAVHAALRRRHGDVEDGADLLVRPSLDVAENEGRTRLEGKHTQSGEQSSHVLPLSGGDVRRKRPPRGRLWTDASLEIGRFLEWLRLQPTSPVSLQCLVDGDSVQPGEGCRLAAEAIEVPPRLHEGVLRRFLDVALVVEEAREHPADATLEETDELGEGVGVALLRTQEQRGFRVGHREDATVSRACDGPASDASKRS